MPINGPSVKLLGEKAKTKFTDLESGDEGKCEDRLMQI